MSISGAVAGVQKIKNACQLARKVLDSEHTMIISQGAVDFAVEQGIPLGQGLKFKI